MTLLPQSNTSAESLDECQVGFPLLPANFSSAFFWSCCVYLILIAVLLASVLLPNGGTLTFVLDDPFIHLRLAENIWLGHYGINLQDVSAPSSSIIWPYLLAPFAGTSIAAWLLLLLNTLLGLGVIYFVAAIFALSFKELSVRYITMLLLGFILLGNLPSLVFVGMEHVLQLLLSTMIVYGLIAYVVGGNENSKQRVKYWLWWVLFLSPLVRYENSLLLAPVLLFLFARQFYWQSILTGACVVVGLLGFSWYLNSLGLGWLPTSVLLKSSADLSLLERMIEKLNVLIFTPKAWFLCLAVGLLLRVTFISKNVLERQLSACFACFILLFLLFGSFGWYYRYEAFAWLSVLLVLTFLYRQGINAFLAGGKKQKRAALALLCILSLEHILVTLLVPLAANNIYLQQYQMGRFVRDYYQLPVAVNDIGLVSYLGEQYTLDLWGLASKQAMLQRLDSKGDVAWMQNLAQAHNVGLAMIYFDDQGDADGWFEKVPEQWQRLGSLNMLAAGVSVSKREVVFFSTNAAAHKKALKDLEAFSLTLPKLVVFEFYSSL